MLLYALVTKLILNSKINQERKRRVRLELQAESLLKQLMVYEKFVATITELESPNGHFGRLRAPIVLENIIKDSKKTERKIKDVRLQEKARQL